MLLLTICLPLLAWLFAARGHELRESLLRAAAVCGIIILALTELLSQFEALTMNGLRSRHSRGFAKSGMAVWSVSIRRVFN